jgi:cytochrome c oxidase assembly protein subunit 15
MKPDKALGAWVLLLAAMVFGMTVGGGHARTIGAGFTIQVWRPFTGFIPPMNAGDWGYLFGLYQKTAVYQANPIDLAQYKALFWPMFLDRCWGRLMALVFLIPFAWFVAKRRLTKKHAAWMLAIFAAGAGQGAFGWYMVQTGMQPGVLSPPPLWAGPHFCTAMIIFALLVWTGLTFRAPEPARVEGVAFLRPWASASVVLVYCTMGFGAMVATTNAITVFNTFPTMDGHFVPPTLFELHPWAQNFIANKATVQFFHRLLATITALTVLTTAVLGLRAKLPPGLRDNFLLLAGLVALQYLLGMTTIVLGAPELGYVHELNGVLLFATMLAARHGLRGATAARPQPALAAAE